MPRGKSSPPPDFDTRALTPREELVLFLFRQLSAHQQREWLDEMSALVEANAVSTKKLRGSSLRPASNETVRAAFKDVPPHKVRRSRPKDRRPPDAPMDDFPDPGGKK